MKSLKTLVSLSALAVCMGAASMANAVSISPDGAFSTSSGTIVVKSPSSFGAAVTCDITFKGNVTSGVATINDAKLTGGGLCDLPVLKNIPTPGWVLTATSLSGGTVTNVGYTITKPLIPLTDCGPDTINVTWNNSTHALTANNQTLTGHTSGTSPNCVVQSLTVTAPSLTIVP